MSARKKKKENESRIGEQTDEEDSPPEIIPFRKHPVLLGLSVLLLAGWFAFMLWVASQN